MTTVPNHPSQTMKILSKKHGVTHAWTRHKNSKNDSLFFYSAKFKGTTERVEAADFEFSRIMGEEGTKSNGYWVWCEMEDPEIHGVLVKNDQKGRN